MRFNVKKDQEPEDGSFFLPILPQDLSLASSPFASNPLGSPATRNNNRFVPIDILSVDKHSRITLTKNLRNVIGLYPKDKIIVYRDKYNHHKIVLQFQKEDKTASSIWTMTRVKDDKDKLETKASSATAYVTTEKNNAKYVTGSSGGDGEGDSYNIGKMKDGEGNYSGSGIVNDNLHRGKPSLYSIPILLVDDEEDISTSFARILKFEGYRNIKSFSDSRKVLMHLCDPKYSCYYRMAIIDIRMPDINGIKLYQILKILNPKIKVLFVTALDAVDELTSIYSDLNPVDIIRKPVEREQLVNTVNNQVSRIVPDW